jgi:hypothetical protein
MKKIIINLKDQIELSHTFCEKELFLQFWSFISQFIFDKKKQTLFHKIDSLFNVETVNNK